MKRSVLWMILLAGTLLPLMAQDPDTCTVKEQEYGTSGSFQATDFLTADQGIVAGSSLSLDTQELDLDNLVLGIDQPFYVDYLSEGAGASHLFGFFFFDIDTDKDGLPDFFETAATDDLDGDGLVNSVDDDDDNDGILDVADVKPGGITQMPASYFRNGTVAAANSEDGNDYWQFLPNSVINDGGDYDGYFEHPGVYLYVDNNNNEIPDALEYTVGANKIPPFAVDKNYNTTLYTGTAVKGLLGTWPYEGTPGNTVDDKYHWTGSTIFYIADDDGGWGQTGHYLNYTPYGSLYKDVSGSGDASPDYLIYGTDDITSNQIPDALKVVAEDGTVSALMDTDSPAVEMYKYRWHEGNISGAREMVFFLVVFWGSGGSNVNTYYSKSAFNLDSAPGSPGRNGATTGDSFGGADTSIGTNWFPHHQNLGNHNALAQDVWGVDWTQIATTPTDGTSPQRLTTPDNSLVTQDWIDEVENYRTDRRIIQHRALADWFNSSPVNANTKIENRYGIDMGDETESSIIRASNGNMVHLMVGAPRNTKDAWLLGWEDLFSGGDRDFEDVVFYVKREAGGQIQSLNVAKDLNEGLASDADYSLSQVSFKFQDNFVDSLWGTEKTYINYYYRFGNADEWIPLLGGQHLHDPDIFTALGTVVESSGIVTREVTLQVAEKATELYWKVEMNTESVDTFKPEIFSAVVGYQSLVHDFYYNSAVVPNSNINYFASFEAPDGAWSEKKNRGHLYALQTFVHGTASTYEPTLVNDEDSPELTPNEQPSSVYTYKNSTGTTNLFKWDAGVSLKAQVTDLSKSRKIYTYLSASNLDGSHKNDLTRVDLDPDTYNSQVVSAMELDDTRPGGVWLNNFHDPGADTQDEDSASLWLINWIHGYYNPVVASKAVVSRDEIREWVMGGVNRASPMIVRAPGLPYWVENTPTSEIKIEDRSNYINFALSQNDIETRVIIGSDNGLIHCIDAGKWVGAAETSADGLTEYEWADGHYEDENFGTGEEKWAFLPGHLLEDVKFNYTNSNPDAPGVIASSDGTGTHTIVKDDNGDWRRVAVFTQGYQGGTLTAGTSVRTGNAIWAMDITDIDNPIPLWHRQDRRAHNIINPPAIAWMEFSSGDPKWVVGYSTGGTAVIDKKPAFYLVEAMDGTQVVVKGVGSTASKGVDVMLGTPALVDSDQNGYGDLVVGATSEGRVYVYNTKTSTLRQRSYSNASFFLAPNVKINSDGSIDLVAVSGDSPLIYDEPSGNFTNTVYVIRYDNGSWTDLGDFDLPQNHKAFSRPKVVNDQLVLGTTTGDTFNFCDFDPDEPGDLLLYDLTALNTDPLEARLQDYGSILAPIIISNNRVFAHTSTSDSGDPNKKGSAIRVTQSANNAEALAEVSVGETFGVLAWQDEILKKLRTYSEQP